MSKHTNVKLNEFLVSNMRFIVLFVTAVCVLFLIHKYYSTFRRSHHSIIKEKIYQIMQITAFKAILARIINIQGCEDYENTFARMESHNLRTLEC